MSDLRNLKPCTTCGRTQSENWPGQNGDVCQDCWEVECDRGWWAACRDLIPTGEPDEYVRIGASCPIGDAP